MAAALGPWRSQALKKQRGLKIVSEKTNGRRIYRLVESVTKDAAPTETKPPRGKLGAAEQGDLDVAS